MSHTPFQNDLMAIKPAADSAALTETVRQVDIIHTTLVGMLAIVIMLLVAVALPVLGFAPITHPGEIVIMAIASSIGIGYLYYLNYRVHQHVSNQARLTEVLVNSLGQGFLTFNRAGVCGKVYSQACIDLLETIPADKNIAQVLHVPEAERADFNDWLDILFQPHHAMGFDDVIKFLPQHFPHSQKRRVVLVYKPIYDVDGKLFNLVLIATDQTEEYAAQQAAQQQQAYADMIFRIFKERNLFQSTLAHLREFLDNANQPAVSRADSDTLLRQLHTLKATVKQFNLLELGEIIHAFESDLRGPHIIDEASFKNSLNHGRQKVADALLKVMDEVKDLIGGEHEWRGNVREIGEKELYQFAHELKQRNADPVLIKLYLSTIAAVPVQDCFHAFDRELKELATVLDKQVKPLRFTGSNPRILTQSIQEFLFSLTHICRNIMDHGIETPITRMGRGKDPAGQVTVQADVVEEQGRQWLRLVIGDDGGGIDPSRIRARLAAIDPDGAWRFEDDQTVIQRIFTWGFTTRDELTTLSGHGVGMEAVEREIKLLGGRITVNSELYKGVNFDIRVPYRLDIDQPVEPSGQPVAIPA